MTLSHSWIATPHLRPDYRGPTQRAYRPFPDPAASLPMIAMLEDFANRTPDAIAVDSSNACLSHRALWRAVRRLQSKIEYAEQAQGPVAILLPADADYVVAVFAVLASRRIGLLLDPSSPSDRNASIARSAGAKIVLVPPDLEGRLGWAGMATVAVADAGRAGAARSEPLALDEPAFILCTSGTTGLPKPIVHSQRTMLNWVRTVADALHLTADDRVLSISPAATLGGFTALLACSLTGASMQMLDVRLTGFGEFLRF